MTNSDFYTITSAIAAKAQAWTHEGVTIKLARGKGNDPIFPPSIDWFHAEISSLLSELEPPRS